MTNNKADAVEEYILKKLANQQEGRLELKRKELAHEVRCAPSQVSYVLSTRFTHERGFVVESQRGMGGYIRITFVTEASLEKNLIYSGMIDKIDEGTPFSEIKAMLDYLFRNQIITRREAELSANMALNIYRSDSIKPAERVKLVRSIFKTIADLESDAEE